MQKEEMNLIYLDNAGTTQMFEECVLVHRQFGCAEFFNPSALSSRSMAVRKQILQAEEYVKQRLGARDGNVLFTGCATESNNLAIMGSVRAGKAEYVFSEGEHPSVNNLAKKLQLGGAVVHFVPLGKDGCIDMQKLEEVLCENTRLVSIIHVSNETGAVNNLKSISALKMKKCPKAILHIDGVQAFMKIPLCLRQTEVDLYSFSGHKFHAPKGIAGLYVRNKMALKPLLEGGGQQYGLRSGTENVSGIMQMVAAMQLIDEKENLEKVTALRQQFKDSITASGIVVKDFGGSPYILNLIFSGVKGETMLHALENEGVIVGLGSACSAKLAGNRVLESIGLASAEVISSARISFNAYMSGDEVVEAAKIICKVYEDIKQRVS